MLANVNSKCSAVSPSGINQNHPAALEIVRISSKQGTREKLGSEYGEFYFAFENVE